MQIGRADEAPIGGLTGALLGLLGCASQLVSGILGNLREFEVVLRDLREF